jgi:hypothetical protein
MVRESDGGQPEKVESRGRARAYTPPYHYNLNSFYFFFNFEATFLDFGATAPLTF